MPRRSPAQVKTSKPAAASAARKRRVGAKAPALREPEFPDPSSYDPRYTSEVAYAHLRQLIILGFLSPGTEIKQSVLAREFGVSRTPLREACRRLQAEGLIEVEVNQRAVVSALDVSEIDALYAARIALEGLGIRLSTGSLTKQDAVGAREALDRMWDASVRMDLQGWTTAHLEFHMHLVAEAGIHAKKIMRALASECDRYLFCYHSTRPFAPRTRHGEHEALLAAVLADDPAVSAKLIGRHLAVTAIDLIHDLDPNQVVDHIQAALDQVDPGCDASSLEGIA
jgi:DNA-binding GntR family transcriptional regulator